MYLHNIVCMGYAILRSYFIYHKLRYLLKSRHEQENNHRLYFSKIIVYQCKYGAHFVFSWLWLHLTKLFISNRSYFFLCYLSINSVLYLLLRFPQCVLRKKRSKSNADCLATLFCSSLLCKCDTFRTFCIAITVLFFDS